MDHLLPREAIVFAPAPLSSGIDLHSGYTGRMIKASIRVGIGGWTYEPWRGTFFPEGLAHKRELEFASHAMTAIEVNGTYYSRQKPATFATWAKTAPDGFVFALKASRYCTNRKILAEAGESIEKFLDRESPNWATSSARSCGSSWRRKSSMPMILGRS